MARFETVKGIGKLLTVIPESDNNWRLPDSASPPPPVKFCDAEVKSNENIFLQPAENSLDCRYSELMDEVVRTQLEHFLVNYDHDTKQFLTEGFNNMVHGWRDMANTKDTCRFTTVKDKPGYTPNCLTMCLAIKDSRSPSDFRNILGLFETFFGDNFKEATTSEYLSELIKLKVLSS